ncbi:MAG: four helix bundle protein [Candidatus Syntrophosphaera sp.]
MYSYTDLDIYTISMDLVVEIYRLTADFPGHEQYGLSSQMRRSAVSIPSNIAEGSGRQSTKEFIRYLYVSNGSLSELETQLDIARRLNYIDDTTDFIKNIKRVRTMLMHLIKSLKARNNQDNELSNE